MGVLGRRLPRRSLSGRLLATPDSTSPIGLATSTPPSTLLLHKTPAARDAFTSVTSSSDPERASSSAQPRAGGALIPRGPVSAQFLKLKLNPTRGDGRWTYRTSRQGPHGYERVQQPVARLARRGAWLTTCVVPYYQSCWSPLDPVPILITGGEAGQSSITERLFMTPPRYTKKPLWPWPLTPGPQAATD